MRGAAFAACTLSLLLVSAAPAHAYRTLSEELRIPGDVLVPGSGIVLYRSGPPPEGIDAAMVDAALRDAAAAWNQDCSRLRVRVGTADMPADPTALLVPVRVTRSGWVSRGHSPTQAAIAYLKTLEGPRGWYISDASISINDDTVDWASESPPDLRAVLLHEIGHCAGLAHPCERRSTLTARACNGTEPPAVMHPDSQAGHWELEEDDIRGLCNLYSATAHLPVCRDGGAYDADGGLCAVPVSCESDCGHGSCAVVGERAGTCVMGGEIGAACEMGEECASDICYLSSAASYCTHDCVSDESCPRSWECAVVAERNVCVVPRPDAPSSCACSLGAPTAPNGLASILLLATVACGLRRRRALSLGVLLMLLGCPASGTSTPVDSGMNATDAQITDDSGSAEDGGSVDAGTAPDGGSGADAYAPDAGPVDGDSDGVLSDIDCDDTDPTVAATASRACASDCAQGTQTCMDGVWTACTATTDCACSTPDATRMVACAEVPCGYISQRCSRVGRWVSEGVCTGDGECTPGEVERSRDLTLNCAQFDRRSCLDTCHWSAWSTNQPSRICSLIPGRAGGCYASSNGSFVYCDDDCQEHIVAMCP